MRRRWRWQWDDETCLAICIVWAGAGVVAALILLSFDQDKHGEVNSSAVPWLFGIWLGPFALAAAVLAIYGIAQGIRWAIRNPPVKRVSESADDLREHYRD